MVITLDCENGNAEYDRAGGLANDANGHAEANEARVAAHAAAQLDALGVQGEVERGGIIGALTEFCSDEVSKGCAPPCRVEQAFYIDSAARVFIDVDQIKFIVEVYAGDDADELAAIEGRLMGLTDPAHIAALAAKLREVATEVGFH